MEFTARALCTEDELARMGVVAHREGGPFGQVLGRHPERLHWAFLAVNLIKHRTWPVSRRRRQGDMVDQWLRIGGGWNWWTIGWNRRMRAAGFWGLQLPHPPYGLRGLFRRIPK